MHYLIIVLTVFFTDHTIKEKIEKAEPMIEKELAGGRVRLTRYHNEGAFHNLLEHKKQLLLALSGLLFGMLLLLAVCIWPKQGRKTAKLGLALLLGGAGSNLYDRIHRGYVVDYFYFCSGKRRHLVYNISDFAIAIGSLLTALSMADE